MIANKVCLGTWNSLLAQTAALLQVLHFMQK